MHFVRSFALLAAMQSAVSAETTLQLTSTDESAVFTHSTSLVNDTAYWSWTNVFTSPGSSLT